MRFLRLFREKRSVIAVCRAMRISNKTAYRWRARFPWFAEAWEAIEDELLDDLEESALRRATKGHTEPIFDKDGNKVGKRRKYETALTIFMLKARRPARYRTADAPNAGTESLAEQLAREDEEQRIIDREKAESADGSGPANVPG